MERTCEIRATRRGFRVLAQDWEFRAVTPSGAVIAASPVFTSSLFIPNNGSKERRIFDQLLADLTAAGWVATPAVMKRPGDDWWVMCLARPANRSS